MKATIAVLIPTRNRPELAINAIRSLLDQDCTLDIYVSDNSTDPEPLREFARTEPRVHYLRPHAELSMPRHWDWAMRQMMERSAATHFSVHYDRKFSKPQHWGALAVIASQWPERLLTFPVDAVTTHPPPRRLWQIPWTGKLFFVRTSRTAALIAGGQVGATAQTLPILSNCVIPRNVLDVVVERFGNVCDATGPDAAFMARFMALWDDFLHYDRAMGVVYAAHRSNGLGYLRGKGGDFPDFMKTWGDRAWLPDAPIPGLNLGYNMLYEEYELARRATGDRLPRLNREAVINELALELRWVDEPERIAELRAILQEHGWRGGDPPRIPRRTLYNSTYEQVLRFGLKWLGRIPATITGFKFKDDETALWYALKYPRRVQEEADHLSALEVTLPQ